MWMGVAWRCRRFNVQTESAFCFCDPGPIRMHAPDGSYSQYTQVVGSASDKILAHTVCSSSLIVSPFRMPLPDKCVTLGPGFEKISEEEETSH